jgi:hypothetical protein
MKDAPSSLFLSPQYYTTKSIASANVKATGLWRLSFICADAVPKTSKQSGFVALTLYICIRKVLSSNDGRDTRYPD